MFFHVAPGGVNEEQHGRSSSIAPATSSAASSLPSYISSEDHFIIFSFMRYYVISIWPI